jgi:hypothetical protein
MKNGEAKGTSNFILPPMNADKDQARNQVQLANYANLNTHATGSFTRRRGQPSSAARRGISGPR